METESLVTKYLEARVSECALRGDLGFESCRNNEKNYEKGDLTWH